LNFNGLGVCGGWSELLSPSMVHGDEGPCLPRRLDATQLCPNSILFLLLSGRDGSSRQVGSYIYLLYCMSDNKEINQTNISLPIFPSQNCSIVGGILLCGGLYSLLWGKSREAKTVQRNIEASTADGDAQDEVHCWELEGEKENEGREERENGDLRTCVQQD
jgi:hypothetical protein